MALTRDQIGEAGRAWTRDQAGAGVVANLDTAELEAAATKAETELVRLEASIRWPAPFASSATATQKWAMLSQVARRLAGLT